MDRGRLLLSSCVSALCLVAGVFACHDTENLPTLCNTKPSAPGCVDAANADTGAPIPFTTDSAKALDYAKMTCAWLAACESPLGDNQTGRCMANAILAFDETANPNRKVKGDVRTFWQCAYDAARMKSCAQMTACTFGGQGSIGACGTSFVGCAGKGDTRVSCSNGMPQIPPAEACIGEGKTCGALDPGTSQHDALCTGPQGRSCVTNGCNGTKLSACNDGGVDLGQDCANFGAGVCVPDAGACMPQASGTCFATPGIACDDAGIARTCVTGVPEQVDCNKLAGGCVPDPAAPSWVGAERACVRPSGCTVDACNGANTLQACVRGRLVAIDCSSLGLGSCTQVSTADGMFPSCTKP